MDIHSAARVMHALAANTSPYDFTSSAWPTIAQQLLKEGCHWPALTELTAMESSDEDEVVKAVGRLAQQTSSEAGGEPLNTWDIFAWLIACCWKHSEYDGLSGAKLLDNLYMQARDSTEHLDPRPEGVRVVFHGTHLWELSAHGDCTKDAEELMARALQLIPAEPFSCDLSEAILEGFW